MLGVTLKKLMYQLFEMIRDPKFVDKNTVIRVVGKDALEYFDKQGYSGWGINKDGYQAVYEAAEELGKNPEFAQAAQEQGTDLYELVYQMLAADGSLDEFAEPLSPVTTAKGVVEKFKVDEENSSGYLSIDPETDYLGEFNFIPDVEALTTPSPEKDYQARTMWYNQAMLAEKSGALMQAGYQIKHKDILAKLGELIRIKDAEQYFEKVEQQPIIPPQGGANETIQGGAGGQGAGPGGQAVSGGQPVPSPAASPI